MAQPEEVREERDAPATFVWTGEGGDLRWSNGRNWDRGGGVPGSAGQVVFPDNANVKTSLTKPEQ